MTGNEAWQAPGAWAAPHARLVNACVTAWQAAGDTVYVAANHAETQASGMSFSISQVGLITQSSIVCVDNSGAGHVPPQAGDIRTSATVTTTGNNAISFSGTNFYCYGITFQAASGGSSGYGITLGTSSGGSRALQRFEACVFKLMSSSNGAILSMGQNYGGLVEWINCNLVCSAAQNLTLGNCTFIWRGGSMTTVGNSTSLILPGGLGGVDRGSGFLRRDANAHLRGHLQRRSGDGGQLPVRVRANPLRQCNSEPGPFWTSFLPTAPPAPIARSVAWSRRC